MPFRALKQQIKEAYIKVSVESCDLPHEQLNNMPLVKLKDRLVVEVVLDMQHHPYLQDDFEERVECINDMTYGVQALTALVNKYNRAHKHDDVVEQRIEVQNPSHFVHQLVF